MTSTPTKRNAPPETGSYINACGSSARQTKIFMRAGMTKCTPMAPASGPLTHGVPCTKPAAMATLMSLNRHVAARTFSISGVSDLDCGVCAAYEGCPAERSAITSGGIAIMKRRRIFIERAPLTWMECGYEDHPAKQGCANRTGYLICAQKLPILASVNDVSIAWRPGVQS